MRDPTAFTALTKIHKRAVLDCCFAPETDQILTASEDNTAVLWNLPPNDIELHDDTINDEHKLVCYRLAHHKTPVTSVAMHKKLFLSASKDGHVNLWRLASDPSSPFKQPYPEPRTYTCTIRVIRSVCFSPDAKCFAVGSDDKSVKVWSTECKNKMIVSFLDGHTNWIRKVQWAKTNDSLLASCGDDGRICIWDARMNIRQPPSEMIESQRKTSFLCLDWHPVFEHHIATGGKDSSCVIWDLRNRKQIQVYVEHHDQVNAISFNPGGSLLLSGSSDKDCKIFDLLEGRNMFTLKSHCAPVTSTCFNANGDLFATGSQDKTVTVWKRNFDTIDIVLDDGSNELNETVRECTSDLGSSIPVDIRSREDLEYYQPNIYAR